MNCNCMELVATGWCTRKWLRFDQIENQIEKDNVMYLVDLFEGMGKKDTAIYCVEHL